MAPVAIGLVTTWIEKTSHPTLTSG